MKTVKKLVTRERVVSERYWVEAPASMTENDLIWAARAITRTEKAHEVDFGSWVVSVQDDASDNTVWHKLEPVSRRALRMLELYQQWSGEHVILYSKRAQELLADLRGLCKAPTKRQAVEQMLEGDWSGSRTACKNFINDLWRLK